MCENVAMNLNRMSRVTKILLSKIQSKFYLVEISLNSTNLRWKSNLDFHLVAKREKLKIDLSSINRNSSTECPYKINCAEFVWLVWGSRSSAPVPT